MGEPAKTQSQPCGYALRCLADGKIYPIHDGFAIGRAFGDLILANVKELSSRHCKFMLSEAGVLIQDLKSTNGVYVNQMKVAQGGSIRVPEGGLIELGPLHFELLITDNGQNSPMKEAGATSPTPNASNMSGNGAESSKPGDDKGGSSQAGGVIKIDPPTKASTVVPASPGGRTAGGGPIGPSSSANPPFPNEEGSRGGTGMMGAVGGSGGGAGGGLGSSGPLDAKGNPAPGAKPDSSGTNPYEVNGGGGKLGAPKGFSKGGESESSVEATAKDNFNKDFANTAPPAANAASPAKTEEEEGYTLFKMVSKRYTEVRRKGWL